MGELVKQMVGEPAAREEQDAARGVLDLDALAGMLEVEGAAASQGVPLHAITTSEVAEFEGRDTNVRTPSPFQAREGHGPAVALTELVNSIREVGLIEPIAVCRTGEFCCAVAPEPGASADSPCTEIHRSLSERCTEHPELPLIPRYVLVAGHRRLEALRRLNDESPGKALGQALRSEDEIGRWERVPATVLELNLSKPEDRETALMIAGAENAVREDVPFDQTAAWVRRVREVTGLRQNKIAQRLGKSEAWVSRCLKVAKGLTDEARTELRRRRADLETAAVVAAEEPEQQVETVKEIAAEAPKHGGIQKAARAHRQRKAAGAPKPRLSTKPDTHTHRIELASARVPGVKLVYTADDQEHEQPSRVEFLAALERIFKAAQSGHLKQTPTWRKG